MENNDYLKFANAIRTLEELFRTNPNAREFATTAELLNELDDMFVVDLGFVEVFLKRIYDDIEDDDDDMIDDIVDKDAVIANPESGGKFEISPDYDLDEIDKPGLHYIDYNTGRCSFDEEETVKLATTDDGIKLPYVFRTKRKCIGVVKNPDIENEWRHLSDTGYWFSKQGIAGYYQNGFMYLIKPTAFGNDDCIKLNKDSMAKKIQRAMVELWLGILPDEKVTVRYKNGNRSDNRLTNLIISHRSNYKPTDSDVHLICKVLVHNAGNIRDTIDSLIAMDRKDISANYVREIRRKSVFTDISDLYFMKSKKFKPVVHNEDETY